MEPRTDEPTWPRIPDVWKCLPIATRRDNIRVGCIAFVCDPNSRVYVAGRRGPLVRHHYVPRYIAGETRVSWLDSYGDRYRKKPVGKPALFGILDVDDAVWAGEHRYDIVSMVQWATPDDLRRIAGIVGFVPKEAPDGE